MTDSTLYSPLVLAPAASLVAVLLFGVSAMALFALALVHARRASRLAEQAATGASAELRRGRVLLYGTVEAEGDEPVLALAVAQRGREFETDHDVRHLWSERKRKVDARPFQLVLDDGTRVRVEAGRRTIVVARFDGARSEGAERARLAAILPGAHVGIDGVLHAASSADGDAPVLSGGWLGRMIVATAPLRPFHRERAAWHRRWAKRFACLFVAIQLFAFGRYWAMSFAGHVVEAPITSIQASQAAAPGGLVWRWTVKATWAAPVGPIPLEDDTSEAFYAQTSPHAQERPPQAVRFLLLRGFPEVQSIGTRPTIERSTAWRVSILMAILAIAYAVRSLRTWARDASPKLVEPGRGGLAESGGPTVRAPPLARDKPPPCEPAPSARSRR